LSEPKIKLNTYYTPPDFCRSVTTRPPRFSDLPTSLLNQNADQAANSIKTEPDEYEYDFESKPTLFKGIGDLYEELPNEAIILNTIGAVLVGLAILMPCILKCDAFKKGLQPEAGEGSEDEEDWMNQKKTQHNIVQVLFWFIGYLINQKKGLELKAGEDSDIEWTKKYLVKWTKKTQHI